MITRRTFLASTAALGAAGVVGVPLHPARAAAAPAARRPGRLVVVFLRGAADHLSLTVPLDEATYHDRRPTTAIAPDATLALDGRFGLHPAMPRLHRRFVEGSMAPVVAVGNPAGDRSHFLAQDLAERGSDGDDHLANGWLARHLAASASAADSPLRALTLGANVDESLVGFPALGIPSLRTFGFGSAGATSDALVAAMLAVHDGGREIDRVAAQALDAAQAVADLPASSERDRTSAAFDDVVTLLDADLGVEVVTINVDGWDTHDRMGGVDDGDMRLLAARLDEHVGGMHDRLDERGIDDVTTLVVTEFGRRVAENGSGGTDHGWAFAALAVGARVDGGRVHGEWPGLAPDVVTDARGDVPMTTDYRDVLGEAVGTVLGGDIAATFPSLAARPVGLFV